MKNRFSLEKMLKDDSFCILMCNIAIGLAGGLFFFMVVGPYAGMQALAFIGTLLLSIFVLSHSKNRMIVILGWLLTLGAGIWLISTFVSGYMADFNAQVHALSGGRL